MHSMDAQAITYQGPAVMVTSGTQFRPAVTISRAILDNHLLSAGHCCHTHFPSFL